MCREIVENVLSGTKAGFKATRNLVFNQKKERKKMDNQKSSSLNDRDYPVVSGINLFFGTFIVLNNLFIDLLYAYLDPRVRYE